MRIAGKDKDIGFAGADVMSVDICDFSECRGEFVL
jgi:hypothetical protein